MSKKNAVLTVLCRSKPLRNQFFLWEAKGSRKKKKSSFIDSTVEYSTVHHWRMESRSVPMGVTVYCALSSQAFLHTSLIPLLNSGLESKQYLFIYAAVKSGGRGFFREGGIYLSIYLSLKWLYMLRGYLNLLEQYRSSGHVYSCTLPLSTSVNTI